MHYLDSRLEASVGFEHVLMILALRNVVLTFGNTKGNLLHFKGHVKLRVFLGSRA